MLTWLQLFIAIACEVVATSALKASQGFSRPVPALVALLGYGVALWLLSLTLERIPLGIAYAVWSGVGLALITVIGWKVFGQALDPPALAGIGLIVAGVLVIHLFSAQAPR